MTNEHDHPAPGPGRGARKRSGLSWVFFGFLAVGGFFLLSEHRAHLMGWLPFILLALCPLMHFFHGGHGGHGGQGTAGSGSAQRGPDQTDAITDEDGRPSPPPAPHQH